MAEYLRPLSEQVVVVTGASSAIGLCTARLAAARGARLVLVGHTSGALDGLAGVIEAAGGRAVAVMADITSREQVVAAAQDTAARFGRIDTWINNGGVSMFGRLDQIGEADSRRLFDVNFWGVVNGSLAAVPHLAAAGGTLINVGSELTVAGAPLQGLYSSAKCAVQGFTDSLRVEVAGAPVSIRLIQPALVCPAAAIDPLVVAEAILEAAAERQEAAARARAWTARAAQAALHP